MPAQDKCCGRRAYGGHCPGDQAATAAADGHRTHRPRVPAAVPLLSGGDQTAAKRRFAQAPRSAGSNSRSGSSGGVATAVARPAPTTAAAVHMKAATTALRCRTVATGAALRASSWCSSYYWRRPWRTAISTAATPRVVTGTPHAHDTAGHPAETRQYWKVHNMRRQKRADDWALSLQPRN